MQPHPRRFGSPPAATSAARSATLLSPPGEQTPRRARPGNDVDDAGPTAPSTGTSRFSSTFRPSRTTSRHLGARPQIGRATVSAAGAPPGPERLPKSGPACPSLPAGATTSVPRAAAPAAARASGASSKAPNGSASGISAIRAASWASPLPSGSTARSSPARIWSVRANTAKRPDVSRCQPPTRIGSTVAPGATPERPSRPEPMTIPAISVPWRSTAPAGPPADGRRSLPGHVHPGQDVRVQVGRIEIDAGVEERHEHAAPVQADERGADRAEPAPTAAASGVVVTLAG